MQFQTKSEELWNYVQMLPLKNLYFKKLIKTTQSIKYFFVSFLLKLNRNLCPSEEKLAKKINL